MTLDFINWHRFFIQTDFTLLRHTLKDGNDTVVQSLQLSGTTTNYLLLGYAGVSFPLSAKFTVLPKVGAGGDLLFSINRNLDASLGLATLGELERSVMTFVFQGTLGIRLRL